MGFSAMGMIGLGAGLGEATRGWEAGKDIRRKREQQEASDQADAAALQSYLDMNGDGLHTELNKYTSVATPPPPTNASPTGAAAITPGPQGPGPGAAPLVPGSIGLPPGSPLPPSAVPGMASVGFGPPPSSPNPMAPNPAPTVQPGMVSSGVAGPGALAPSTAGNMAPPPMAVPPAPPTVNSSVNMAASPHAAIFKNHVAMLNQHQDSLKAAIAGITAPVGSAAYNNAAAQIYRNNAPKIDAWRNQIMSDVGTAAESRGNMAVSQALAMARQGKTEDAANLLNANGVNGDILRGSHFEGNQLVMPDGKTKIEMPDLLMNFGQLTPKDAQTISMHLHQYDQMYAGKVQGAQITADSRRDVAGTRADWEDRRTETSLKRTLVNAQSRVTAAGIHAKAATFTEQQKIDSSDKWVKDLVASGASEEDAHEFVQDQVRNGGRGAIAADNNISREKVGAGHDKARVAAAGSKKKKAMADAPAPAASTPTEGPK